MEKYSKCVISGYADTYFHVRNEGNFAAKDVRIFVRQKSDSVFRLIHSERILLPCYDEKYLGFDSQYVGTIRVDIPTYTKCLSTSCIVLWKNVLTEEVCLDTRTVYQQSAYGIGSDMPESIRNSPWHVNPEQFETLIKMTLVSDIDSISETILSM